MQYRIVSVDYTNNLAKRSTHLYQLPTTREQMSMAMMKLKIKNSSIDDEWNAIDSGGRLKRDGGWPRLKIWQVDTSSCESCSKIAVTLLGTLFDPTYGTHSTFEPFCFRNEHHMVSQLPIELPWYMVLDPWTGPQRRRLEDDSAQKLSLDITR